MGSTANIQELEKQSVNLTKWFGGWKLIAFSIIFIIALIIAAGSYYQANHFNSEIKINSIDVGGMTTEQALNKLKTTTLTNVVYIGDQHILDGKDSKMRFTAKDLPSFNKLLKSQWTFFPSSKAKNYSLIPVSKDQFRNLTLKKQVEEKLLAMNQNLKVPQDAVVRLEQGKIVVSKSISGEQYDVGSLLKDYDKHKYISEIHLSPIFIQPIKEDSEFVKNEQKKLEEFLAQTVDYKVQDKIFSLTARDLIKNASITRDLKITLNDDGDIKNKLTEINHSQSTLNKDFTFKTHSGSMISVKGKGYGWAINVDKEVPRIKQALENGEKSVSASNIYGNGWKGEGYGYDAITNNGIGNTYAEVSIAEQRIWIYKNGKLVVTTNVVTGTHSTHHDTSPGVWYILYKQTPAVLTGRENGKITYQVDVNYWAPFTNDGQGFHDASWRGNWGSKAYLSAGSHGCVNTPPSIMKTVYSNLSTYEPVVIY
ncbi:L,D-transpeptidase/peptidoglycan binding protein [Neobacillus drentensis]|uniref:L,D-transpeptidase family protein n=1 Tax=Neobacillus drentensis TaxID=220684 RepID=UPI001F25260A|nr:L,D-transpeptidase family protein [Neobacillus drentensis]ULT54926.1 L,D-transpeptidase/peptidoglycan binding protein [Neobacillus drentensis]